MENRNIYQSRFESLRCCVIVPTYNNQASLKEVLDGILKFTSNIVVVNDGSNDGSRQILDTYENIMVVNLPQNTGKGYALRVGFRIAQARGFLYGISIDSDGQHFPDDIPVFLDALEKRQTTDPELLVIGSRKMDGPDVPGKSSIGNRVSSFWYWVETGIKLQDTQCGYRLYPLRTVNSLPLRTKKFELEIEVIVKAAWKGVEVINLPVKVFYDPLERVSHFRPFQDVARITLLNIMFVGQAISRFFSEKVSNIFNRRTSKKVPGNSLSDPKVPLK